jgi:hypothetical protein
MRGERLESDMMAGPAPAAGSERRARGYQLSGGEQELERLA